MNGLPIFVSIVDTAKEMGGVPILSEIGYGVNMLGKSVHTKWHWCRKHVAKIVRNGAKKIDFAIAITSLIVNEHF